MSENGNTAWDDYSDILGDLDKDNRVGRHDFLVSEVQTFDWQGETIFTVKGVLVTANNAKATLKWSRPPAKDVIKAEMAGWTNGRRRGIKKSINIGKQLADYYGKGVNQLAVGDLLHVVTERVNFTNKKTGQTGQMTEVMAILPKDQIGKGSAELARAASDIPF